MTKINIKKDGFRDKKVDFVIKDEEEAFWEVDVIPVIEEEIKQYEKTLKFKRATLEMARQKLKEAQLNKTGGKTNAS